MYTPNSLTPRDRDRDLPLPAPLYCSNGACARLKIPFAPAFQNSNWSIFWSLRSAGDRSISLEIRFIPHAMKEGIAEFLRPRNLLGGHALSKAIPCLGGAFVSLLGS